MSDWELTTGLLDDIVEVVTGTHHNTVNLYLDAGYRLLGIEALSRERKSALGEGRVWVKKSALYIMGRTEAVEHFNPPPRKSRAEDGDAVHEPQEAIE